MQPLRRILETKQAAPPDLVKKESDKLLRHQWSQRLDTQEFVGELLDRQAEITRSLIDTGGDALHTQTILQLVRELHTLEKTINLAKHGEYKCPQKHQQ